MVSHSCRRDRGVGVNMGVGGGVGGGAGDGRDAGVAAVSLAENSSWNAVSDTPPMTRTSPMAFSCVCW